MRRLALGEDGSLEAMAGVLGADEVLLLPGPAHAAQVLVSEPGAEAEALRAAGYGAKLVLPIGTRGQLVAYSRRERPWTRFQLGARAHPRAPARSRGRGRCPLPDAFTRDTARA